MAPQLRGPNCMKQLALAVGVLLGACSVGDDGGDLLTGVDDRDDTLGIVCNAMFKVTGSFTPGTPARPVEVPTGCWPVGTWTFSASIDTNECPTPPALASTYAFRVDRTDPDGDGWVESYTYMGDQAMLYKVGVSEGGGAECEGGLELYSVDGTEYWNFKPMQGGTTINGFGEYAKYETSQR
ncbi:MAG TPA: hypothetical protein VM513_33885 [Kofleriaceae bacterium]|nr:hypothetical protein [Kofleriaceae bacterium]